MRKSLLLLLFIGAVSANAQSTIFAEDWDGVGPGIADWTLYNVDNRTPEPADPLSPLITDAWNLLTVEEIDTALELGGTYEYPAAATGMDGNVIASNSYYNPVGAANDWLVSPLIAIPAGTTGLNLNWAVTSMGNATYLEDYRVYVSPTGGSAVADFTVMLLDANNESNTGNYRTQPLANYAGTSIRIAFRNDSVDQYVMLLDNISVTGTLSNADFLAGKFSLSPNPANNVITISNSENILLSELKVTDINGRTIKTVNVNNLSETQLNVSELSSGIYFLNINTDNGKAVKKFIKS